MKIRATFLLTAVFVSTSATAAFNHVTKEQVVAAQELIQLSGYKCDSVDEMQPFVMGGGFNVYCNGWKYHYELEDKGGNWTVTVQ